MLHINLNAAAVNVCAAGRELWSTCELYHANGRGVDLPPAALTATETMFVMFASSYDGAAAPPPTCSYMI